MTEALILTVLGALLSVPADAISHSIENLGTTVTTRRKVGKAVADVLLDLKMPNRIDAYDAHLPPGVVPQPTWQWELTTLFSDHGFLVDLADSWAQRQDGSAATSLYRQLEARIGNSIDPDGALSVEARAATASMIIDLMGYRLDEKLFGPFLQISKSAYRKQELIADSVEYRLDRAADAADVDAYLHRLIEFTETDLLSRLGIQRGAHELDCQLGLGVSGAEITADDILTCYRRVLITGEPGAGKTWLSHRLARLAAIKCLDQLGKAQPLESLRIPIFARCAEIDESTSLYESLVAPSRSVWPEPIRAERLLKRDQQPLLFIFDSFDESKGNDRIREHIETCSSRPNVQLVLTSRPTGVPREIKSIFEKGAGGSEGGVAQLLPLREDQARMLVQSTAAALSVDPLEVLALLDSTARSDLLQNPLLATLSVLAVAEHSERPILTAPELYDRAVRNLMRREAKINRANDPSLTNDEIEDRIDDWARAARTLGWSTQDVLEPSQRHRLRDGIPRSEFRRACEDAGFDRHETKIALALFAAEEQQYRFLHRSIHENLVASQAAANFSIESDDEFTCCTPRGYIAGATIVQLSPENRKLLVERWEKENQSQYGDLRSSNLLPIAETANAAGPIFWGDPKLASLRDFLFDALIEVLKRAPRSDLWSSSTTDHEVPAAVSGLLVLDPTRLEEVAELVASWIARPSKPVDALALQTAGAFRTAEARSSLAAKLASAIPNVHHPVLAYEALVAVSGAADPLLPRVLASWLRGDCCVKGTHVIPHRIQALPSLVKVAVQTFGDAPDEDLANAIMSLITSENAGDIPVLTEGVLQFCTGPQRQAVGSILKTLLVTEESSQFLPGIAFALTQTDPTAQDSCVSALLTWLRDYRWPPYDGALTLHQIDDTLPKSHAVPILKQRLDESLDQAEFRQVITVLAISGPVENHTDLLERVLIRLAKPGESDVPFCQLRLIRMLANADDGRATKGILRWIADWDGNVGIDLDEAVKTLCSLAPNSSDVCAELLALIFEKRQARYAGSVLKAVLQMVNPENREGIAVEVARWMSENTDNPMIGAAAEVAHACGPSDIAVEAVSRWLARFPDHERVGHNAASLADVGGDAERSTAIGHVLQWLGRNIAANNFENVCQFLVTLTNDNERHRVVDHLCRLLDDDQIGYQAEVVGLVLREIVDDQSRARAGDAIVRILGRWKARSVSSRQLEHDLAMIGGPAAVRYLVQHHIHDHLTACLYITARLLPPDEWQALLSEMRSIMDEAHRAFESNWESIRAALKAQENLENDESP